MIRASDFFVYGKLHIVVGVGGEVTDGAHAREARLTGGVRVVVSGALIPRPVDVLRQDR